MFPPFQTNSQTSCILFLIFHCTMLCKYIY